MRDAIQQLTFKLLTLTMAAGLCLGGCTAVNPEYDPSVLADGGAALPADSEPAPAADSAPAATPSKGKGNKQPAAPGPRCTPGAFRWCQSLILLRRCNAKGDGYESVHCKFGCNPKAGRCNLCDTKAPAWCDGDRAASCSSKTGAVQTKACSQGCKAGKCITCTMNTYYLDSDGDGHGDPKVAQTACAKPAGYVSDDLDCDDANPDVFKGQTKYFTKALTSAKDSFDYDCDSVLEPEYPQISFGQCAKKGSICEGSGWMLLVPPCGGFGLFIECKAKASGGCDQQSGPKTQACQ